MNGYEIRPVSYKEANDMVVENHYLHRKAPTMYSFGLFDGDSMIGTIIYGKPANRQLCRGVCGPEESERVIELTRLWVKDGTPKNTESFLIGRTLRMLPREHDIVVSYAEIQAGHVGVVYQATNWLYTGMSDRHVIWHIDGVDSQHQRHLFDAVGGINKAKEVYGDRMVATERPRKHRYVFFTGSQARRKELRAKLRYEVKPYPKADHDTPVH